MPRPQEQLAQSLERLQNLQKETGSTAIRSRDLLRADRERLTKAGFIREVMKGWYVPSRPDEARGESTAWYASFWDFCAAYLNERFGDDWCLSPEQSLALHAGNWTVPAQLLIRSPKGGNNVINLPHKTSLLDVKSTGHSFPRAEDRDQIEGLRLFSVESALIHCAPTSFIQSPTDLRAALATVKDTAQLLSKLLDGEHTQIAGRLAGAFRNIGHDRTADEIRNTMVAAGYKVNESDPFKDQPAKIEVWTSSPAVNRMTLLWQSMREQVNGHFPAPPGPPTDITGYLKEVDATYVTDAYHSLSIEGYRVSTELIEKVRSGNWDPDLSYSDKQQRDAMAARGYWQAFQAVYKSVEAVLKGANSGTISDQDHSTWYRELFAPSVQAGLLKPSDLAGYRRGQVFIRSSMHVPIKYHALPDVMPAFFTLLTEEKDPAVRVVLGHFFFVYIHPYMDGNGRIGRFLMNVMLASGGYPWTVVPVDVRKEYMNALEQASVGQNIVPFTTLLARLVSQN